MPRLALTVQTVARTGTDIGAGQAVLLADGAEVANDGNTRLKLVNGSGGAIVVTFVTALTVGEAPANAVADPTVSVPATSTRWAGPWPPGEYNATDGLMDIDVAADGVTMTPVN